MQVQGVSEEYLEFSTFNAERGRMISPIEIEPQASGRAARLGRRRPAVRDGRSDRQDRSASPACNFRVVGVSAKKGAAFGNSLDEFVVIPLGAFQKLFGTRQSLELMVKPRDPTLVQTGQGRGADRAANRAAARSPRSPTTSASSRRTRCSASSSRPPPASPWCSSASSRCRSWSAAS